MSCTIQEPEMQESQGQGFLHGMRGSQLFQNMVQNRVQYKECDLWRARIRCCGRTLDACSPSSPCHARWLALNNSALSPLKALMMIILTRRAHVTSSLHQDQWFSTVLDFARAQP